MQPIGKKILTISLVGIALLVGIVWYVSRPQTESQSPASSVDGGNGAFQSRSTVTISPSEAQAQAEADLQNLRQAYEALFNRLIAQKVAFAEVGQSSTGAEGEIYKLYADDIALDKQLFPNTEDSSIQVAMLDLNQDGVAEALVYEDLASFCGTGGCAFEVYQKKSGAWVKIFSTASWPDIALANVIENGYFALYLPIRDNPEFGVSVWRFSWSGTTYKPGELMAHWSGEKFVYPDN